MARRDDFAIVAAAIAEQLGDPAPEDRQRIRTALEALGVERTVALLMQALSGETTGGVQDLLDQRACGFFQRVDCASDGDLR